MVYVLDRHAKNLRHVSPQNRFTLKEFETTTREIGLTIFRIKGLIVSHLPQIRLLERIKLYSPYCHPTEFQFSYPMSSYHFRMFLGGSKEKIGIKWVNKYIRNM